MATTPNYSWVMPDPTDFVTDLPADFETFGDAVDASLYALSPGTTAGDLDYYTSSTAKARLGIGTAGQVLQVNAGATAPEWVAASGGGSSAFTLLNSGGTSLSGSTTTVSGISGYEKILVEIVDATTTTASSIIKVTINGVTSGYRSTGFTITLFASYSPNISTGGRELADSGFRIGRMSATSGSPVMGYCYIIGGTSSGDKYAQHQGGANDAGSNTQIQYALSGTSTQTAPITSVGVTTDSGTFSAGSVFVYASA